MLNQKVRKAEISRSDSSLSEVLLMVKCFSPHFRSLSLFLAPLTGKKAFPPGVKQSSFLEKRVGDEDAPLEK